MYAVIYILSGGHLAEQLTLAGIRLQDNMTFENYYPAGNAHICNFLQTLFQGNENYVYLWGKSGAGCSHLLQACCHFANAQDKVSMYLPLREFTMACPDMLDDLDTMDLLVLDDIECAVGNNAFEESLFHLFNRLRQANKILLIGGKQAPRELGVVLPDLLSRLTWGVTFKVEPLSDADKAQALQLRAKHRGMLLPPDVAHFLLRRYSRDAGDLFAALDKLDIASLTEQRKLTIPFVKEVLSL